MYVVAKMKDLPFTEAASYYLVSQVQEITPAERHLPLQMLVLIKRNSKTVILIGTNKPELEMKAKFFSNGRDSLGLRTVVYKDVYSTVRDIEGKSFCQVKWQKTSQ